MSGAALALEKEDEDIFRKNSGPLSSFYRPANADAYWPNWVDYVFGRDLYIQCLLSAKLNKGANHGVNFAGGIPVV